MTEQKKDRRVKRTKKMIRDALSELMKNKAFEEISVTDITKKADINRGTFYLHYEDKYDLLDQSEEEIIQEINKIAKRSIHSMDVLNQDVIDHPLTFVVDIFQYIKENEVFMKAVLGPKGPGSFRLKIQIGFDQQFKTAENSDQNGSDCTGRLLDFLHNRRSYQRYAAMA